MQGLVGARVGRLFREHVVRFSLPPRRRENRVSGRVGWDGTGRDGMGQDGMYVTGCGGMELDGVVVGGPGWKRERHGLGRI